MVYILKGQIITDNLERILYIRIVITRTMMTTTTDK